MRMSCNGCRVLRKGCTDNCSIRPCLQWIRNPDSQANATVFLAKFYGRAGLLNLINAAPHHLQPAVFRSLLYEACGRIVNPIYGSVGLLWSGSWQLCQGAVEAVLKGEPIVPVPCDSPANRGPPLKAYDIRHVVKEEAAPELRKVKSRCRFKRSGAKPKRAAEAAAGRDSGHGCYPSGFRRASSHESSVSHQSEAWADGRDGSESVLSGEASPASSGEAAAASDESDVELELTLGLEPRVSRSSSSPSSSKTQTREMKACSLDFPA